MKKHKNLAERQRERARLRKQAKQAPITPVAETFASEEEDAAELEYKEKTTRKKRSTKMKKDLD